MTQGLKIVYCAVVIFVWMVLNYLILQSNGGGALTTILMFIMIAVVVAIWKYKPESTNEDNDKHQLDKK